MRNVLICFPNRIDQATLSGGTWEATLPRSNLQNRTLGKVARTSTDATSATQFDVDLAVERFIRCIALVNHNISLAGKARIRASTVSNFATTVYDSGWVDVWPTVHAFGDVAWGEINWWDGKYSDEERAGYTATYPLLLTTAIQARYWRVEIDDTSNAAGYIQIGRVFIGDGWQPEYNMSYGASIGWEPQTEIQQAKSGAEYFDRRTPYRVVRFELPVLSHDEGMGKAFELFRRAGIDQEVFYAFDPTDTIHALRRQYLGRLREMSAIEYPYYNLNKTGFEIKELL
jgi:hypothetical protein